MNKNGYTGLELLGLIIILGVITILATNKISHAFSDDPNYLYKSEQKLILLLAKNYGNDKINELKELKNSKTITVNDLIVNGYLTPSNDEGDYFDPRNNKRKMNDINIKITYDDKKKQIETKFME